MDNIVIITNIIQHLPHDIHSLSLVSKQWNRLLKNDDLWKILTLSLHPSLSLLPSTYDISIHHGRIPMRLCFGKNEYLQLSVPAIQTTTTPWKHLFQQLYIKDNLIETYRKEMNKITSVPNQYDKMKACFEKCRMLNAYQSLKRNEYIEKFKERSPYLTMILDSVLYKHLHSSIKHSYDGCDEGMGRTDTILLEGILFDVNGNPIDFNFKMRTKIYGGHSDGYSVTVDFKLGKTAYVEPNAYFYRGERDEGFDTFIKSCQKELCCGDTSKLQFYEVFLLLSAMFPYKGLDNKAQESPFVTITDEDADQS